MKINILIGFKIFDQLSFSFALSQKKSEKNIINRF